MFRLSLADGASAALADMPERVRAALADKAAMLAAELQAKIEQKLSGGVLNAKTGALARSIIAAANISVTVTAGADIKYAAIHEFGGVIPPHEIVPDKARALAFLVGGKQAFAGRVQIPAVAMPERSYMRSSLAEMTDEIANAMTEAIVEAMR